MGLNPVLSPKRIAANQSSRASWWVCLFLSLWKLFSSLHLNPGCPNLQWDSGRLSKAQFPYLWIRNGTYVKVCYRIKWIPVSKKVSTYLPYHTCPGESPWKPPEFLSLSSEGAERSEGTRNQRQPRNGHTWTWVKEFHFVKMKGASLSQKQWGTPSISRYQENGSCNISVLTVHTMDYYNLIWLEAWSRIFKRGREGPGVAWPACLSKPHPSSTFLSTQLSNSLHSFLLLPQDQPPASVPLALGPLVSAYTTAGWPPSCELRASRAGWGSVLASDLEWIWAPGFWQLVSYSASGPWPWNPGTGASSGGEIL